MTCVTNQDRTRTGKAGGPQPRRPPGAALPLLPRRRRSGLRRWILLTLGCWTAATALGIGAASLVRRDLPEVLSLEDYEPPVLTRIYARDGTLVRELGNQKRLMVHLSDLPMAFRQAVIASEDADFYRHPGVDLSAILRAAWNDILARRKAQGASTITQQLARDLFLSKEKTWTRKLQEWLFALQIEKSYTKDEILEMYCNQIYFGHGFYGIEAASRFYFGKPASALTLDQSALLAGLVQRPETYSPVRNPELSRQRRDHVLRRMVREGDLTAAQAEAAAARPVAVRPRAGPRQQVGLYFLEEIRRKLVSLFGENTIYKQGLEVRTTLDVRLQALAEKALRQHLRRIGRGRGFRPITENVIEDKGLDPEQWVDPDGTIPRERGETARGVVLSVAADRAVVRLGSLSAVLDRESVAWTGESDLRRLMKRGDVTLFRLEKPADGREPARFSLDQEPAVEGAVILLDPGSGEILALVGGYDFHRSQFDRAVQARRQVGSAFKPFLYAAAIEKRFTPADLVFDGPTVFVDPTNGRLYQPENYERDYLGLITLRTALEHSRNIAAVKLINAVGYAPVFDVAHRLGIRAPLKPYPSLALGATEISLLEMTAAYGAFANGGLLLKPHFLRQVMDADRRQRFRTAPEASEALDPAVAAILTQMLQGVVRRGTAASISDFPRPVAGKTGTTDGHSDAWFIGFTPHLVCGVWVGLDQTETIGSGQSGARAALPIWNQIMREAVADRPPAEFPRPPGVTRVPIDPATGRRAAADTHCGQILLETFLQGTEPTARCGPIHHFRKSLPYFLQRLPVGDDLRLHLTQQQLDDLLEREGAFVSRLPLSGSLSVVYGSRALTVGLATQDAPSWTFAVPGPPTGAVELDVPSGPLLETGPPVALDRLPEPDEDMIPLAERRGRDGRVPDVVVLKRVR
ncbi:MAG: penicillin-binding protein 1A [Acidobacteriota bacterium]